MLFSDICNKDLTPLNNVPFEFNYILSLFEYLLHKKDLSCRCGPDKHVTLWIFFEPLHFYEIHIFCEFTDVMASPTNISARCGCHHWAES